MKLHVLVLVTAAAGWAAPTIVETMISAKSGTINYIEGTVLMDQKPIEVKYAQFPRLKNQSLLQTREGRVEMLLADGIFLRLGENSAVRMLSDSLIDTRLELTSGSAVVEWADQDKHEPVTFSMRDASVTLVKHGLYRIDSAPPRVRVFDGEAHVEREGQTVTLKKARELALEGVAVPEKFDNKSTDALMRWARRRSEYLSYANITAAKNSARWGFRSGGWVFNPWYGAFTYLPLSGIYSSFWGYQYYSPYAFYSRYYYRPSYSGGGYSVSPVYSSAGRSGVPATYSGTSGTAARSAPPTAAASSGSAPISRGSGHAGNSRGR